MDVINMSISRSSNLKVGDLYELDTVDRTYAQTFVSTENPKEDYDTCIRHERRRYFINIHSIDQNLCAAARKEHSTDSMNESSICEFHDIGCSFSSLSVNSSIMNEDLILNDEISLMSTSRSNSPLSPSLAYTITEVKNIMSSVFESFNWQLGLVKSLPESKNVSIIVHCRSFDTQNPCVTLERMDLDLKVEFILPAFHKTTHSKNLESDSDLEAVFRKTCCEPLVIEGIDGLARNTETKAELFTEIVTLEMENNNSTCGCSWCRIF